MVNTSKYQDFDHDAFARSKGRGDFWGQIRRTVNGKSVSEEQIDLIVSAITIGLNLKGKDIVLDVACGNGALSARLFRKCRELHGVDLSEYLISVAQEHFQSPPQYTFTHGDAVCFLRETNDPEKFTKAVCYGSFSYLDETAASEALTLLYERFEGVQRVFIGNLPDLDLSERFFTVSTPPKVDLKKNTTSIGIWRTKDEFRALAEAAGWKADFKTMEGEFYASGYRYDVVLVR